MARAFLQGHSYGSQFYLKSFLQLPKPPLPGLFFLASLRVVNKKDWDGTCFLLHATVTEAANHLGERVAVHLVGHRAARPVQVPQVEAHRLQRPGRGPVPASPPRPHVLGRGVRDGGEATSASKKKRCMEDRLICID